MCFSATASFTAAAVLIPSGIYCLKKSNQLDKRYWAIAMLPLLFGLQQFLEGGVWLALQQGEAGATRGLALGFLFFSHVFWLGWIPFSVYQVESYARLKRFFLLVTIFGVVFGASMFVPLLFNPTWLGVSIVNQSIYYDLSFIFDAEVSQQVLTVIYAVVIIAPLLLCSERYHRVLGGMILASGLFSWAFYDWVFVSVWCYFAAIISLTIFFMVARSVITSHASKLAN